MSGRVVREVANGAKKVSIILAEEVQDRGFNFKRVIAAIDPARVAQTADKVANAFSGSKLLTASQKEQAPNSIITYDQDRNEQ